jgi:general secretion pathway protein J
MNRVAGHCRRYASFAARVRVAPAATHRARGFTLLEILVAVSLLALLIALAVGSLRTAVRAARSGEALVARTDRMRVAQEFLRRQLSHAMPLVFERMEDSGENRVFVADRESLRFVAPMPGYLSRGGPHVQWLTFERGIDGMKLVFDHAQLNGYDPDDPKGDSKREPVVLLEGFSDGEFEYRALDEQGELDDWSSSWDDTQRLPLLVRLRLEYDRDARERWPDLEIPILTATATPGLFSPGRMPGRANPPTVDPPQNQDGEGR